ncbi:MAG: hypothetical protein LBK06_03405 [Planctomycetaceae bacterium]|jgi:membrane protein implicated in regulation of membrane protease activity|nr:hypothetical protein [Planctomycetaceae bacterium]
MQSKESKDELISDSVLRQVICWSLFAVVLLPCGVLFLLTFFYFFWVGGNLFAVNVLGYVIAAIGFFWFMSIIMMLLCLAINFLQNSKDSNNDSP